MENRFSKFMEKRFDKCMERKFNKFMRELYESFKKDCWGEIYPLWFDPEITTEMRKQKNKTEDDFMDEFCEDSDEYNSYCLYNLMKKVFENNF